MSFDCALYLTRILLAVALIQQSLEHVAGPFGRDRLLFGVRAGCAAVLLLGPWPMITCFCLLALNVAILHRYDGPYNGGADRMTLLVLVCLSLAHLLPDGDWAELALAYLAFQLVFSYALSGWVKLRNPDWRSGRALVDVFLFSAYPVSEALRGLSDRTRLLFVASWSVIGLEIFFPLALFHPWLLAIALGLTVVFHIANACVFGLNRFLWAWLAAYPSLIWFQARIFD